MNLLHFKHMHQIWSLSTNEKLLVMINISFGLIAGVSTSKPLV